MIVGLLSWYDESPTWLSATVASAAPLIDHLIAVDGAYALYPHREPASGPEQAEAITEVCAATGIGLTLHRPAGAWLGNEVEKRSFLFELGERVTTERDWYIILDGDEVIRHIPEDFTDELERTDHDAVVVSFWERTDVLADNNAALAAQAFVWQPESLTPMRIIFRAVRGLHCLGNHYTYATGDGRLLWTGPSGNIEPALEQLDFVVEHRTKLRPQARRKNAGDYYARRDKAGLEVGPCDRCGTEDYPPNPAHRNWRREDGTGQIVADPILVCPECLPKVDEESREAIAELGADPERLVRAI